MVMSEMMYYCVKSGQRLYYHNIEASGRSEEAGDIIGIVY